jgi:predicted AAA+ superfamily ATPase
MQLALNQMRDLTSSTKLKQRMAGERFRISSAMVSDVIGFFEDAYLLYMVDIFSMNAAVRSTNPKKFYCSDHALAMAVAEKLTPDLG